MDNRYAVVDEETGLVTNVVIWDGSSKWGPPEGQILVQHATAGPGGHFEGDTYVPPVIEEESEPEL